MTKIRLIKKIRDIIKKHNYKADDGGILYTLAPAKEIADYIFERFK